MTTLKTRETRPFLTGLRVLVAGLLIFCVPIFADELDDASKAYHAGEFEEAASLLRPLTQDGVAEAQYLLGRMYEQGDGVEKNPGEAQRLYKLAAKQNHAKAAERLSQFDGAPVSEESVVVGWYLPAAKEGDSEAQYNLGYLFETGLGVKVNEKESARWYTRAAELQHDSAQLRLGMMYIAGANGEKDLNKGKELLRSSAKNGNRIAETLVQELFDVNDISPDKAEKIVKGIRRVFEDDENKLLATLQTSIDRARSSARTRNAPLVETPRPVERARTESTTPERQQVTTPVDSSETSSQTLERAQETLGKAVELGVIGGKSAQEVVRRYQSAAEKGNADAQVSLGVLYIQGKGVPKDMQEGLRWITQAAEQGHQQALNYLNLWKEDLNTVTLHNTIALPWLIESARQWDLDALYALGFLYETGRGVAPSAKDALKWYRLAASQGHVDARNRMGMLQQGGAPVAEALGTSEGAVPGARSSSSSVGPYIGVIVVVLLIIAIWKKSIPFDLSSLKSKFSMPNIKPVSMPAVSASGKLESEDLDFLKELWANKNEVAPKQPVAESPVEAKPKPSVATEQIDKPKERPPQRDSRVGEEALDKDQIAKQVEEKLELLARMPAHEERAEKLRKDAEKLAQTHDAPRKQEPLVENKQVEEPLLSEKKNETAKPDVQPDADSADKTPQRPKTTAISADFFSDTGISRDSLAISKTSAETLFGRPFPIDTHGKVIKRVERAPSKIDAEQFIGESDTGFGKPRRKEAKAPEENVASEETSQPAHKVALDILEHSKSAAEEQTNAFSENMLEWHEPAHHVNEEIAPLADDSSIASVHDALSFESPSFVPTNVDAEEPEENTRGDQESNAMEVQPEQAHLNALESEQSNQALLAHLNKAEPEADVVAVERAMDSDQQADEFFSALISDDTPLPQEEMENGLSGEEATHPVVVEQEDLTDEEERSLAEVHYNIGVMFATGDGVPQNDILAAKWFEKAANEGLPEAQYGLAELYLHGRGVAKNTLIALEWLEKSSANGYLPAQELLNKKNKAI